ncbi:MAG: hypothetical protein UT86_C0001G0233 [Candidatus Magasanikbacteria bacterium GW2011_GWC2_40_17]|uniref:Uncharacterized protein n=1 Tax=Candidatus Magasanikbacteria bacterium GW2011_GWA2_42_32 TaxID=1619039 RepID=A0A0G1D6D8_9BACT|nr:MAG: hypothetical protein UT86_C0001G0233 [Candidatus Magasanikbacteria bacterium GW2011_GWC2_40_17]KKS57593.1 MAG: hypothetical protein UV20_C0001G0233 [Candidatus Magasanikbacteria bacterium GW2011_GWA2_42_32]
MRFPFEKKYLKALAIDYFRPWVYAVLLAGVVLVIFKPGGVAKGLFDHSTEIYGLLTGVFAVNGTIFALIWSGSNKEFDEHLRTRGLVNVFPFAVGVEIFVNVVAACVLWILPPSLPADIVKLVLLSACAVGLKGSIFNALHFRRLVVEHRRPAASSSVIDLRRRD